MLPEVAPEVVPEALPESAKYILAPCPSPKECLKLNGAPRTKSYEKTCCDVCAGIGVVPADQTPNPEWDTTLQYLRRPFSTREQKRIEHEPGATVMETTAQV